MNDRQDLPLEFRDLVDDYCSGLLDDAGRRKLEEYLLASASARHEFVAYFHMHTELEFAARARRAAAAALARVGRGGEKYPEAVPRDRRIHLSRWLTLAAGVLIAITAFTAGRIRWRHSRQATSSISARTAGSNVAWLVNAQDCLWAGDAAEMPGRDMRAGKVLRLRRGLAEIEFDRGATLILQGPARLQLLSGNAARLLSGALTARVPPRARGFAIESPQGRVVDLGTEFGLSIDEQGATAVQVFEGKVEAFPRTGFQGPPQAVTLHEDQAASIDDGSVALRPRGESVPFIRAIVPPPLVTPHERSLTFDRPAPGALLDSFGQRIGLTHRLPGTGFDLKTHDLNLVLNSRKGTLELTTTRSDINTQQGMASGEYLGFHLADLGFTGPEDFAVSATIPEIPSLQSVGQFGLYAGSGSDRNIRGGLISQPEPDRYLAFLVNNNGGIDSDLYEVGMTRTGDHLRLTLKRTSGAYSLVVENLTRHSSSTLAIAHPAFLDGERNLYVGLFGANTQSDVRKTLTIKAFGAKVWTVSAMRGTDAAKK
jgi:hypothetical protein